MTIRFLRTLIAISEKGNFTDAADQVCVSPAAVSQQMKRLEEILDVNLFDRDKRTPELTLAGKSMVPRAREIVRSYDTMLSDVKNESPMSGELTIGAVSSSLVTLLPISIKTLLNQYPEIHIRVITAPSHDLLPQLDRGAIDAAVMSKPLQLRSHFSWQAFAEEDMVVICSEEVESNDPLELLNNHPYIRMTRHTLVGVMADDILHDLHITMKDTMELESLESITSMVSHNLGVAIVPKPCVIDRRYEGLKFVSMNTATTSRSMGVLSRQDTPKFRMVDSLMDALVNTIEDNKKFNEKP